jgi:hypothetical protein
MHDPKKDAKRFSIALREVFMTYYKDHAVSVQNPYEYGIWVDGVIQLSNLSRRTPNYVRDEWRMRDPRNVVHRGTTLCEMQKKPDEVKFYKKVWERSEVYSMVYDELRQFFANYLPHVTIIDDRRGRYNNDTDGSHDAKRILKDEPNQDRGSSVLLTPAARNISIVETRGRVLTEVDITNFYSRLGMEITNE